MLLRINSLSEEATTKLVNPIHSKAPFPFLVHWFCQVFVTPRFHNLWESPTHFLALELTHSLTPHVVELLLQSALVINQKSTNIIKYFQQFFYLLTKNNTDILCICEETIIIKRIKEEEKGKSLFGWFCSIDRLIRVDFSHVNNVCSYYYIYLL